MTTPPRVTSPEMTHRQAAVAAPERAARAASPARTIELCGRWFVVVVVATWVAGLAVGFERALTALVAIGFAGAVAGLAYPALGVLSVAMLCAIDSPTRVYLMVGGLLRFNTFNYLLVGVMLLGLPYVRRMSDPHSRLLQLFVALLAVELLLTPDLVFGLQHFLNVVAPFGLLVYFAPAATSGVVWYWVGVATGTVGAAGGMLYYLQRDQLPPINPNAWSLFPLTALFAICLALPVAFELRRGRVTLMLLTVANWGWVFLSGSRGGLLTATICILYLIVTIRGVGGRVTFLLVAGIVGLAILTEFIDLQAYTLRRLDRLFDSQLSLASRTSGRSELIRGGWAIFVEHPLGVGTGGFADAWSRLGPSLRLSFGRGQEFQSHSGWLKVLVENGVPGFLLFAGFVGSFLVVGLRAPKGHGRALGALTTLVLGAAFITTEFQAKGLWFLAAGAATLLHRQRIAALLRGRADG